MIVFIPSASKVLLNNSVIVTNLDETSHFDVVTGRLLTLTDTQDVGGVVSEMVI